MSRLCRLKSYKSIGEDGLWAYNEIIQLRATITEQAALIKALDEKAQFNFDQYQKMDAEYLEAGAVCMNRIKALEDALREAKESISDLAFWDNGKPEFESAHLVIAAINELIGE